MITAKTSSLLLIPSLFLSGCVHEYAVRHDQEERTGRVESVYTYEERGDPAGGAAAGAVIGGVLGSVLSGGRAGGTLFGAIGGAAVGADASQGHSQIVYDVTVRFDDGGVQTYAFRGYLPFQQGEAVVLTPEGLRPYSVPPPPPPEAAPPPPEANPPPPDATPPPQAAPPPPAGPGPGSVTAPGEGPQ